jgi:hypothetical protein
MWNKSLPDNRYLVAGASKLFRAWKPIIDAYGLERFVNLTVADAATVSIAQGKFFGLIGPNDGSWSKLVKMLVDEPTAGAQASPLKEGILE